MDSSKFNTSSPLRTNAGNASPLRARLKAALDAYDKENAVGQSGAPPKSQTPRAFNRHSLPGSMNTHTSKYPFDVQNGSAAGLQGPLSIRGRLSDGGAISNQVAGGFTSTSRWKPKEKRSASMADMDEPPSPPKRPRRDDEKNPFVFIKNVKLFHEDNILARRMFLDLVEAQDKRAVYGGHNPREIHTMGPCIDPKDLFDKRDTSLVDTHFRSALDKATPDYTVILESEGDSIFGSWFHQLSDEDGKNQNKGADGSSQKSGGPIIANNGEIPPEDTRADVAEAPAGCETNGDGGSPLAPLPLTEAATNSSSLNASLGHNPPSSPSSLNSGTRLASTPPAVVQVPPEVVPEASQLPKAKKAGPEGEKKKGRRPKTAQAGSSAIVGSGVAGPSTSASTSPFAYSDAQAQEIWKLAYLGNYLGAHTLFDSSEQAILIEGEMKVQNYLEKNPKLKKRLESSPEGTERECLYLCGASAIWKRTGDPKDLAAGEIPTYELTYERCKDYAYPTVDNYKKHVYRHHLDKFYKPYRHHPGHKPSKKEAGEDEEKEESVKGKDKAPLNRKKAKVAKREDEDSKEEDYKEEN